MAPVNGGDIDELAELVQKARAGVVFTGAGISTECGIPDFRSPGGFWTRFQPISYDDFRASEETRREAWRRFFMIQAEIARARPGPSHLAVAELARRGHVASIITQNIDGLHAEAGIARERIIELHGNGTYARCLDCGERHELDWVRSAIDRDDRPPPCQSCGGLLKSATISFGQAMPDQAMADARAATLNADLFIAIGSSLQVFPAAGFPVLASRNRTPLVILNREETGLDGLAQLVLRGECGEILSALIERLGS
ncbi:MAG: NAD-dependent deacetylase [Alphaproteobacteria bacterium]|nr:NAD-dependent deacetylase [Alphaproteobacteria bacterium]